MTGMEILKPGDICPCCGNPIKTTDPDALYVLSIIKNWLDVSGGRSDHDEK